MTNTIPPVGSKADLRPKQQTMKITDEQYNARKELRKFLYDLDNQDGTPDGIIADNVWSKYETIFGIKSSPQESYFNSKGEKCYKSINGVNVESTWAKIIKKDKKRYG